MPMGEFSTRLRKRCSLDCRALRLLSQFLRMAQIVTIERVISHVAPVAPVIQLPIIWLVTRELPAPGAWFGAACAVVGTAMVLA